MSDYGTLLDDNTIRFERLLPGPIERVWAYLTESDKRGTWLASGPMELRPGGRIEFHFKHSELSPHHEETPEPYKHKSGTSQTLTVSRCDPPYLLVHSWPDSSEVTYELTPKGDEVLLTLTHRRLTPESMQGVFPGWHTHLGILVDRLNSRTPQPFWSTFIKLKETYAGRRAAASSQGS